MGLPSAIKAHAKRDFKNAKIHYERALSQESYSSVLFQNYGALLREIGELDRAKEIYNQGLSYFPGEQGIEKNYINLLLDISPAEALPRLFKIFHSKLQQNDCVLEDSDCVAIIECLRKCGYNSWAYDVLFWSINHLGITTNLAIQCVRFLCDDSALSKILISNNLNLEEILIDSCLEAKPLKRAELFYTLSWYKLKFLSDTTEALDYLTRARSIIDCPTLTNEEQQKFIEINNVNSWNASNVLLQNQQFEIGWKLFEHGLRSPAKGPQAWQRALPKPFTHKELPLWQGSSLKGKKILLLEEQAIGDAMQFITLVPTLANESLYVALLVSNRLLPIYKRTFAESISNGSLDVFSLDHVSKGELDASNFDYQSPLGSVCQYRFTHRKLFPQKPPILIPQSTITEKLRKKYLLSSKTKPSMIIGLSWRGGGTKERMGQKSISVEQLAKTLNSYRDIRFVSLQYGDCINDVRKFKEHGVDLLLDNDIDAVNSFDNWLSQVSACDAVISVANTTIHGSGGLNIPTLCLLSKFIDWRWISDRNVDQSYWYPSVGIARQEKNGSWNEALARVKDWIGSGCVKDWSTSYTVQD